MSPYATILKLGAEQTVQGLCNYLLHNLGRKVKQVKSPKLNNLSLPKIVRIRTNTHYFRTYSHEYVLFSGNSPLKNISNFLLNLLPFYF